MKLRTLFLVLVSAAPHAHAGPDAFFDTSAAAPSRWSVGVGYAPVFGLKAEFSGLGQFASPFAPQPIGGGVDYEYDNGYVRVDSSGNAGGQTWNWGYSDATQYDPSGGGSIAMTQTNSLANGRAEGDDDAGLGLEIEARYHAGAFIFGKSEARWGFRAGLHYADVGISNGDAFTSGMRVMTDRFALNGVVPPLPGYAGSFGGPGPMISDSPTRVFSEGGNALVTGLQDLDVDLFTLNFGPWLEIPVASWLDVTLEAGVSAALASGEYSFVSNTTAPGLGSQTSTGSDSGTDLLLGAHFGLGVIHEVGPQWDVFLKCRYQFMPDFDLSANGSNASLDFGSAFLLSAGVIHSF